MTAAFKTIGVDKSCINSAFVHTHIEATFSTSTTVTASIGLDERSRASLHTLSLLRDRTTPSLFYIRTEQQVRAGTGAECINLQDNIVLTRLQDQIVGKPLSRSKSEKFPCKKHVLVCMQGLRESKTTCSLVSLTVQRKHTIGGIKLFAFLKTPVFRGRVLEGNLNAQGNARDSYGQ